MTPLEQLADLYEKHPQPRTLSRDIELHLATGYVFSTPQVFAMGRAVLRHGKLHHLADPGHIYTVADCWLVYAWVGPFEEVFRYLPYKLRWVCWARRGKPLRFYELDKVMQKWQGVISRCDRNTMFSEPR